MMNSRRTSRYWFEKKETKLQMSIWAIHQPTGACLFRLCGHRLGIPSIILDHLCVVSLLTCRYDLTPMMHWNDTLHHQQHHLTQKATTRQVCAAAGRQQQYRTYTCDRVRDTCRTKQRQELAKSANSSRLCFYHISLPYLFNSVAFPWLLWGCTVLFY